MSHDCCYYLSVSTLSKPYNRKLRDVLVNSIEYRSHFLHTSSAEFERVNGSVSLQSFGYNR